MMFETILEFHDDTLVDMKVEIAHGLVRITEADRHICVTVEGLADIADAVEQHSEIESLRQNISQREIVNMATFWAEYNTLHAKDLIPGSIEDSIKKWRCLHNLAIAGDLVYDGGRPTCSLCLEHTNCIGCPIHEFTGLYDCAGTPYENYYVAVKQDDVPWARESAAEMVEFLERLLYGWHS